MSQLSNQLEWSLREFERELESVRNSIFEWLNNDPLTGNVNLDHSQATRSTCEAILNSIGAVVGFLEIIKNPEDHDEDSLEAVVSHFEERRADNQQEINPGERDSVPPTESMTSLVRGIETATGVLTSVLEAGVRELLSLSWFSAYDTVLVQQDVDFHLRLIKQQFVALKVLVVDLIDPRFLDLAQHLAQIESHVKSLKQGMSITAER